MIDVEGVYTGWMSAHDVQHLLVRPDFYVAATAATGEEMGRAFDRIVASLSLKVPTAAV